MPFRLASAAAGDWLRDLPAFFGAARGRPGRGLGRCHRPRPSQSWSNPSVRRHRSRAEAKFRGSHLRTHSASRDGSWAEVGVSAAGDGAARNGEASTATCGSGGGAG